MESRIYVISLDLLDPTLNLEGVREFIKTSSMFENWWNHIPGVFLVISRMDAATISEAVRRYTNDARLLITETNLDNSDGWLPDSAWTWVRRRSGTPERTAVE